MGQENRKKRAFNFVGWKTAQMQRIRWSRTSVLGTSPFCSFFFSHFVFFFWERGSGRCPREGGPGDGRPRTGLTRTGFTRIGPIRPGLKGLDRVRNGKPVGLIRSGLIWAGPGEDPPYYAWPLGARRNKANPNNANLAFLTRPVLIWPVLVRPILIRPTGCPNQASPN